MIEHSHDLTQSDSPNHYLPLGLIGSKKNAALHPQEYAAKELWYNVNFVCNVFLEVYCIRIRTRGGIYGKIWLEPEGLPEGSARGQSQGFRPYFTVYPNLSPNTDIIPFLTTIY